MQEIKRGTVRALVILSAAAITALSAPVMAKGGFVIVNDSDVQDLYAKLSDPATDGETLLLSGTYLLTATGNGESTKGFIDLGSRNLKGTNVMMTDANGVPVSVEPTSETVINGTELLPDPVLDEVVGPDAPGGLDTGTTLIHRPLIRASAGNSIEGVTVRWVTYCDAANNCIGTRGTIGILGGKGARITRSDIQGGGGPAILISNQGFEAAGSYVSAGISSSIVRGTNGSGIVGANYRTRDSQVYVTLNSVRAEGGSGPAPLVFFINQLAHGNTVTALSQRGLYRGSPVAALQAVGGFLGTSSGNRVDLTSINDAFVDSMFGSVVYAGAGTFGGIGPASEPVGNEASVQLLGTTFSGNSVRSALIAGAIFEGPIDNFTRATVFNADQSGAPSFFGHAFAGSDPSNRLVVSGNAVSFSTASGVEPLPENVDIFSGNGGPP